MQDQDHLDAAAGRRRAHRTLVLDDPRGIVQVDADGREEILFEGDADLFVEGVIAATATIREAVARFTGSELVDVDDGPVDPDEGADVVEMLDCHIRRFGQHLNRQRDRIAPDVQFFRAQPARRQAMLRYHTIREIRALRHRETATVAMAPRMRGRRESSGRPTRTRGSRRSYSRGGDSGDDGPGESDPPPAREREHRPLVDRHVAPPHEQRRRAPSTEGRS